MVMVCDAIMGTGKTESSIAYMNAHPGDKFIYITPYLDEAARIARSCPLLEFQEPQRQTRYHGSKLLHTEELVRRGCNIATTHQAFKYYSDEMLTSIREQGYTLFIDENVNVLEPLEINAADFKMALDAGYIRESEPNVFTLAKDVYDGEAHKELFKILKTREVVRTKGNTGKNDAFYWQLPGQLLAAFRDVFILTYMFEGQSIAIFLQLNGFSYSKIGVEKTAEGFRFCEGRSYVPEYVSKLKDMLHIVDDPRLNAVGDDGYALSLSWFARDSCGAVSELKNNLYNFFRHRCSAGVGDRMWSTFTDDRYKLRGKGYSSGFVPFNTKATNEFRNKTALAYCVNVYMNVGQKVFFLSRGVEIDDDAYALSIMVQWIWRSAIRDGREVTVYVPSKRMRDLLVGWVDAVSKLADTKEDQSNDLSR